MKVAVIKLGSRISYSAVGTSGANGEAVSIIQMLYHGGCDVVAFTKILQTDTCPSHITWRNIEDEFTNHSDCDVLVIINGNVNFFGGAEDRPGLLGYHIINNFKGPVFYVYCDPNLVLNQIWSVVKKKPWGQKYRQIDIEITRDIAYLSQPWDTLEVSKLLKTPAKSVIHYPFEKFPCMGRQIPRYENAFHDPNTKIGTGHNYDLSYGGTFRGGRREKKMIKFYFGHPETISIEMFGKIKSSDFDPELIKDLSQPKFNGVVRYDEFTHKMNSSLSTCVIGDPKYEKLNDVPQRVYECIWSNVVTFIDADMDKARRVYGKSELSDFLYVNSREQLSERIAILKTMPEFHKHILEEQIRSVNWDMAKYATGLVDLIRK